MHPLIARFLDLPAAVATLEKTQTELTLDSEEAALISAAIAFPAARDVVLKAKDSKSPSPQAQQQLIILATRAATARLALDPVLGPRITTAKAALEKEGASPAEADDLVAQAVLEEAFGYAEDPDTFDGPFLAETLESLAHLAAVTQDTVDGWLESFARGGTADERAMRLKVAEVLLESAWSEGPQPITPEHLDDAIEQIADAVAGSEFDKAAQTLELLLAFLLEQRVLGPERKKRLSQVLTSATASGAELEDEEDDEAEDSQ